MSSGQLALAHSSRIGTVVIGRNEGERLIRCLKSLTGSGCVIYVDSQSTDGSADAAASMGADVVTLDMQLPFTAARARNAGFARLQALRPTATYVQFVDGDCEVIAGWMEAAINFLDGHPDMAAVCGRRLERFPSASIYNAMCHSEWNTPPGPAMSCGGDSIMRMAAFAAVGGFSATQMAHEEPELCGRLRKAGWKLWRLDAQMTMHDAAIYHFAQYYKRNRRAGFGISQALCQSGCDIDPEGRVIVRRALVWAILLPLCIVGTAFFNPTLAATALIVYPLQIVRHAVTNRQGVGDSFRYRFKAAAVAMAGKFAEAHGIIEFLAKRYMGKELSAIHYK